MRKPYMPLVIAIVVVMISSLAIAMRGKAAMAGISWGVKNDIASVTNKITDSVQTNVNLGVYDPNGLVIDAPDSFALEHEFIQWEKDNTDHIATFFKQTDSRERWPILTIEPFPDTAKGLTGETLFGDIVAGEYDQHIARICGEVKIYDKPVFIRWGHEMENITGRYSWAKEDANGYIAAYQYFVDTCRNSTDKAYYVWSPVGNGNLSAYWPGVSYVDYVGLSTYIFPDWEMSYYKRVRTFDEVFSEKYNLVKDYGRPIMIAEFGIAGEKALSEQAILKAFSSMNNYPLLKTVVFFNAVDTPGVWGKDLATPDWTIDKKYLNKIRHK